MPKENISSRADTFPVKGPMMISTRAEVSGADASVRIMPPCILWKMRGVFIHIISGAGLDTGETFDIISEDIVNGDDQGAWTFTAKAFTQAAAAATEKFYMCHTELKKCWVATPGSAARAYDSGIQIVLANGKVLSTVAKSSLPSTNSPVLCEVAFANFVAGDSVNAEITLIFDNCDESW